MVSSSFFPFSFWGTAPPIETGEAAPRLVPGAMAAMCAAYRMNVPALAARAPLGATNTTTGTGEARIALITSRIEVSRPPGVSTCTMTSSAPSFAARSMDRFTKCALAGPTAPSSGTSTTGAAAARRQAHPQVNNRAAMRSARMAAADYAPAAASGLDRLAPQVPNAQSVSAPGAGRSIGLAPQVPGAMRRLDRGIRHGARLRRSDVIAEGQVGPRALGAAARQSPHRSPRL